MKPDLTVSIVTYNDPYEMVQEAIQSLLSSSLNLRIFLICNGNSRYLSKLGHLPGVQILKSPHNLGYGGGHNLVLKSVVSENIAPFHLVMNPDVFFQGPVLEELSEFMKENSEVGLVMPKVLYPNGRIQYLCRLLPTPVELLMRRFGFIKQLSKRYYHLCELRFTGYRKIMEVPFLSGCFMFLRVEALKKVGLFDERYFLYFEDVDLCRRLLKFYKNVFYPLVHIYHIHRRSSYHDLRLFSIHLRSAIQYFNKWGWFRDPERDKINREILRKLHP